MFNNAWRSSHCIICARCYFYAIQSSYNRLPFMLSDLRVTHSLRHVFRICYILSEILLFTLFYLLHKEQFSPDWSPFVCILEFCFAYLYCMTLRTKLLYTSCRSWPFKLVSALSAKTFGYQTVLNDLLENLSSKNLPSLPEPVNAMIVLFLKFFKNRFISVSIFSF